MVEEGNQGNQGNQGKNQRRQKRNRENNKIIYLSNYTILFSCHA